ncbi:MAG TPA: hypothetical protein VMU81_10315 [Acetobacteraceae bacterium]|nr:hypothetical protein [Acetobacteraceae bacterium]
MTAAWTERRPQFVALLGIIAGFVQKLVPSMLDEQARNAGGSAAAGDTPAKATATA